MEITGRMLYINIALVSLGEMVVTVNGDLSSCCFQPGQVSLILQLAAVGVESNLESNRPKW